MKQNRLIALLSLLTSLFIYLFYRTGDTVINELFISIISLEKYDTLKASIQYRVPLNDHLVYSIPGGLWLLSSTLLFEGFYVKIFNQRIKLFYFPLVFSLGLETLQLIGFTNGQVDFWDVFYFLLGWLIALYFFHAEKEKQNLFQPFTIQSFIVIAGFLVVYLAHVWK